MCSRDVLAAPIVRCRPGRRSHSLNRCLGINFPLRRKPHGSPHQAFSATAVFRRPGVVRRDSVAPRESPRSPCFRGKVRAEHKAHPPPRAGFRNARRATSFLAAAVRCYRVARLNRSSVLFARHPIPSPDMLSTAGGGVQSNYQTVMDREHDDDVTRKAVRMAPSIAPISARFLTSMDQGHRQVAPNEFAPAVVVVPSRETQDSFRRQLLQSTPRARQP